METNRLIQEFLSVEEHEELYKLYRKTPTEDNKKSLNSAFETYYKMVRVISYLNKVIHFESKNMDKKIRTHNERYQLILDKPLNDEENRTSVNLITDGSSTNAYNEIKSRHLEDYFQNPKLIKSIDKLTKKQKNILYLSFVKRLTDVEISRHLEVSQQSISKTKNKALGKIRNELERGDISA